MHTVTLEPFSYRLSWKQSRQKIFCAESEFMRRTGSDVINTYEINVFEYYKYGITEIDIHEPVYTNYEYRSIYKCQFFALLGKRLPNLTLVEHGACPIVDFEIQENTSNIFAHQNQYQVSKHELPFRVLTRLSYYFM